MLKVSHSKQGTIFSLGTHPSATHVYSPCYAGSIHHLDPNTPMLFLNIGPVYHLGTHFISNIERPDNFWFATYNQTPSFYVLCPTLRGTVEDPSDHGSKRYFVPSEALASSHLQQFNEKELSVPRTEYRALQLPLEDGELIDRFTMSFPDILRQCHLLLQQQDVEVSIPLGSKEVSGYKIQLNRYRVTMKEVMVQYMLHHNQ